MASVRGGEGVDTQEAEGQRESLKKYCIDPTEVTVGPYRACVAEARCTVHTTINFPALPAAEQPFWRSFCNGARTDHDNHPINCVDWAQADTYCRARGGLSFGGYLALVFARLYPERLAGLLLMSTRAAADTPPIRQQPNHAIALVQTRGVHALVAKQLPTWLPPHAPDEARETATTIAMSQRPDTVVAGLEAMLERRDATPSLGAITVRTRIVSGTEDKLTKPDEMRLLTAIPRSVFHAVEGAGHLVAQTHPGSLIEAARTLVTEVESGLERERGARGRVGRVAREEVEVPRGERRNQRREVRPLARDGAHRSRGSTAFRVRGEQSNAPCSRIRHSTR